jgi:hypothetical protein
VSGVRIAAQAVLALSMASCLFFLLFIQREGRHSVRIQTELSLAHSIQQTLVPKITIEHPHYEIYGASVALGTPCAHNCNSCTRHHNFPSCSLSPTMTNTLPHKKLCNCSTSRPRARARSSCITRRRKRRLGCGMNHSMSGRFLPREDREPTCCSSSRAARHHRALVCDHSAQYARSRACRRIGSCVNPQRSRIRKRCRPHHAAMRLTRSHHAA